MPYMPSERCETCSHYTGGQIIGGIDTAGEWVEGEYLPTCKAFPDGIPEEINDGDNLHTKPLKSQDNHIVYKEGTK